MSHPFPVSPVHGLDQSIPTTSTPAKFPKVVTYSAFRNSRKDIGKFFERRDRLTYPKDRLQHFCLEGDSADDTYELLRKEAAQRPGVLVKKADFNSPHITGWPHPGRAVAMAKHSNFALRALLDETDAEYVLLIESDLDYPPDLIERFLATGKSFVAPMVMVQGTENFYDTFAYRKRLAQMDVVANPLAACFSGTYPFHPVYRDDKPFEVDSAGSCLFFHKDVIRKGAKFSPDGLIVAFCDSARQKGFSVWVDPRIVVWHPVVDHAAFPEKWRPWHETKITMKYQEQPPVDATALTACQDLEFARPLEFAWIVQRLFRDKGRSTLNTGLAHPNFPAYLASLGLDVVCSHPNEWLDRGEDSEEKVGFAEIHEAVMASTGFRYRYVESTPTKLPFEESSFEQVISIWSIGFQKDDCQAFQELHRVCKPGGKILLSLPYDHTTFWWDDCHRGARGRYYYNFQSILDRFVTPTRAQIKDFNFIRFELPSEKKAPSFAHPANSGVLVLELEKT